MSGVRIKKVDLESHKYADTVHYRPDHSEWLKAMLDFKKGYMQAVKDFDLSTTDELWNCHGTSMNRIELLESNLRQEKQVILNLRKVIKELKS